MPGWPIEGLFCRFAFLPFNKNRNFAKFGCARGAGSVTPSVTPCQPPARTRVWHSFWETSNSDKMLQILHVRLLRDKLLHDLVENYAEITPKLHAKNATPPTPKIGRGAKRRGQFCAPPVSRFCVQFGRNFGVLFNQIVQ